MKNIKTYLLFAALAGSVSAHAATECFFESNKAVDLQVTDVTFSKVVPAAGAYKEITPDKPYTVTPTSAITSNCNAGKGGQSLQGKNDQLAETNYDYATIDGKNAVLFKTDLKGLYYTLKIINNNCQDNSGWVPNASSFINLADVGDDREKQCMNGSSPFSFALKFFVGPEFVAKSIHQNFKATTGSHATFRISGAADTTNVKFIYLKGTVN